MRFAWRRLRPGEPDAELIWLCVTVAGAGAAILWLALKLPWPICTFRMWTGFPCVTCGATRSALALAHGDMALAWRFNPLIFGAICAVIVFDLYAIAVLCTRAPRLRIALPSRNVRALLLIFAGAIGLLNWIYVLRQ